MMERMSIKSYAIKHKLSMFNVMKIVKSGKLVSDTEEKDSREMTYIVIADAIEKEVETSMVRIILDSKDLPFIFFLEGCYDVNLWRIM